jgi:hypothetical protein
MDHHADSPETRWRSISRALLLNPKFLMLLNKILEQHRIRRERTVVVVDVAVQRHVHSEYELCHGGFVSQRGPRSTNCWHSRRCARRRPPSVFFRGSAERVGAAIARRNGRSPVKTGHATPALRRELLTHPGRSCETSTTYVRCHSMQTIEGRPSHSCPIRHFTEALEAVAFVH